MADVGGVKTMHLEADADLRSKSVIRRRLFWTSAVQCKNVAFTPPVRASQEAPDTVVITETWCFPYWAYLALSCLSGLSWGGLSESERVSEWVSESESERESERQTHKSKKPGTDDLEIEHHNQTLVEWASLLQSRLINCFLSCYVIKCSMPHPEPPAQWERPWCIWSQCRTPAALGSNTQDPTLSLRMALHTAANTVSLQINTQHPKWLNSRCVHIQRSIRFRLLTMSTSSFHSGWWNNVMTEG